MAAIDGSDELGEGSVGEPSIGRGAVLLTGATGFLGGQILARVLERGERHVYAVTRGSGQAQAEARLRAAIGSIYGTEDAYADRVTAVAGDLTQPFAGIEPSVLDRLAEEVTDVVHAAATVSFSLPLAEARAVNVGGTEQMLRLAELCRRRGRFGQFSHLSTTYVAGTHDARFTEDDLDVGQRFRNSYERSKFEAELLVRRWESKVPICVIRPGIVVGEARSGWTPAFNVLYYPIKLFARGVNPPIVPARRDTPIDAVPVDYVADAVFDLVTRHAQGTFHLVAGARAGTVGELLDESARKFDRRPPTLIPLGLYMATLHRLLRHSYRGARKRQLERGAEFLPYFSMRQTFDDRRAREALVGKGVSCPPLLEYFDRLLEFAVATDWGKQPVTRAEARARAAPQTAAPAAR